MAPVRNEYLVSVKVFIAVLSGFTAVHSMVFTLLARLLGVGGDRVNKPEVLHQGDDSRVLRTEGDVPGSDQQVRPSVSLLDILSSMWPYSPLFHLCLFFLSFCSQTMYIVP